MSSGPVCCDDDVVIVNETQPKVIEIPFTEGAELDYPSFYKLKSMALLKLMPGRGWAKVAAVNLFLAKCVQTKD